MGGSVAVESFFIISGFYMSLILNEKYVGKSNSYRLFITNRFLRLYPIYWAVLLLSVFTIVLFALANGKPLSLFPGFSSGHLNLSSLIFLILTNLLIFGQDMVLFLGLNVQTGHLFFTTNFLNTSPQVFTYLFVPQAWTLGLELMFYLLAPFILKKGLKVVLVLILLSLLLRVFIYDYIGLQNDPWTYRFFPTELSFFLLGNVSYRLYLITGNMVIKKQVYLIFYIGLTVFTIIFSFLPSIKFRVMPFSINEIVYFLGIIISIPLLFSFLKRNKWDNQFGELSYPIYITHILVGSICYSLNINFIQQGWVIALFSISLSLLLNYLVARPIEKFRQSRLVIST